MSSLLTITSGGQWWQCYIDGEVARRVLLWRRGMHQRNRYSVPLQFNLLLFFCHYSCSVSPNGTVVVTPATETLSVNGSTSFSCNSEVGPSNVFQWSLNGGELPGENGTMLSITGVDAADGGTYTCTVSNAAGMGQGSAVLYGECHKSLLPGVSLYRSSCYVVTFL